MIEPTLTNRVSGRPNSTVHASAAAGTGHVADLGPDICLLAIRRLLRLIDLAFRLARVLVGETLRAQGLALTRRLPVHIRIAELTQEMAAAPVCHGVRHRNSTQVGSTPGRKFGQLVAAKVLR